MPGRADAHTESVTSDVALQFANAMLRRFDVDWAAAGYTDADLDELAEHLLRIIQSFVIDPGRPPRHRPGPPRATCGGGLAAWRPPLILRTSVMSLQNGSDSVPETPFGCA